MESDQHATLVWNPGTHAASDARYLNGLRIVQGRVEFDLAGREIPADFLAANHAICTGCHEKAEAILLHLSDEDLTLLEGMPLRTDLLFYLGKLYTTCGQLERARDCLHKILSIEPHPIVHYQLSEAYLPDLCCVSQALEHIQQAVSLCPNNAFLLDHLGRCLLEAGRAQEAVQAGEQALALVPESAPLLERLLWRLNYVPQTTRQSQREGYQRWGRLVEPPRVTRPRSPSFARPAAHPLRIGLLSPDFRRSSAGMLIDPFISAYDRQAFEVYGYGHVRCPDDTTERFRKCLDGYHPVFGLEASDIAALIRGDGIDILITIGGHCRDSRLDVVALQPAPILVGFGGNCSAGLAALGYRIGDELMDPPDSLSTYLERTIYLPGGHPFFVPPDLSPLVTSLPARSRGYVTFGSINNQIKISDPCLDLWARVLRAVPESRLVMKCPAAEDLGVQAYFRGRLEVLGVQPKRVEFVGQLSPYDYLSQIAEVDLMLDTTPCTGHVTTLESLWMGVPVVTLKGDTFVSRQGFAILKRVGLDTFVAADEQAFVTHACHFASHLEELAQVRAELRHRMMASPMLDPGRYARELSHALTTIHRHWRAQGDSGAIDVGSSTCEPKAQAMTAH